MILYLIKQLYVKVFKITDISLGTDQLYDFGCFKVFTAFKTQMQTKISKTTKCVYFKRFQFRRLTFCLGRFRGI